MVFSNNLLLGASAQTSVFSVDNACRFNDDDSPELSLTYSITAPWTFSAWVKRCELGAVNILLGTSGSSPEIQFNSGDTLTAEGLTTTALFRDPSAWYHIHVSNNGLYINGVSYGAVTTTNLTNAKLFDDFDGYVAEVHLKSGTTAYTSFGGLDSNGVWRPLNSASVAGEHYLTFSNSAALGENSGSGSDWTATNLTSADQVTDTPTLNYATLSPLWAAATLSDGNLVAANAGTAAYQWAISTVAIPTTGKWVFEAQRTAGTFGYVGICQMGNHNVNTGNNYQIGINVGNGDIVKNSSVLTTVTAPTSSVVRIEYDADADDLTIFDDGVSIYTNTAVGLTGQNSLHFYVACYSGTTFTTRFGASGFSGTPSTGYNALSTANLPEPSVKDPSDHFQTQLVTKSGTTATFTLNWNADTYDTMFWLIDRTVGTQYIVNGVRGYNKWLKPTGQDTETTDANVLSVSGTTVTLGSTLANNNWLVYCHKAGLAASRTTTNGGTLSPAVYTRSTNSTSGFSIIAWTGTGVDGTLTHGLPSAMRFGLFKKVEAATDWRVFHYDLAALNSGNNDYALKLNDTASGAAEVVDIWDGTAPTSSVFSVGTDDVNKSAIETVSFVWSEVVGYSNFSYVTGNASADGPLSYNAGSGGSVLLRRSDAGNSWWLQDDARPGYNVTNNALEVAVTAEVTTNRNIDILSSGVKIRNANAGHNASSGKYLIARWGMYPFGGEGVSPAVAR